MSWSDNLQQASFGGVPFEVLAESSKHGHAHGQHEYPYRDGANVESLGLKARRFSFEAFFWGPNYERDLQALLARLEERTPAELIHPVYGSVRDCLALDWEPAHKGEEPDQATLRLEFIESKPLTAFFETRVPLAKAAAVTNAANKTRDVGAAAFTKRLADIRALIKAPAALTAFTNTFDGAMTALRLTVAVATSGLSILSLPLAWVGDVRSIFTAIRNISPLSALLSSFTAITALASFFGLGRLMDSAAASAVPATSPAPAGVADGAGSAYAEARELAAQQLRVESVTVLAETAADLLAQEALTPALSPADLEAIAADIRARAQACVDWYRAHLEMERAHEAAEALKELAWSVQDLAASVIQLRPPIIERVAEGPACLRLLAHQWYGEHGRAPELLRLNPRLQLPNFIERGQALNAYAE